MDSKQSLLDHYVSSLGIGRLISIQMALRAAIELNIFDIIANSSPHGQLTSTEIVSKIPTKNPNAAEALERILRMLSSHSLLSTSQRISPDGTKMEKTYGLTTETHCLVTDKDGFSLAPVILYCSERAVVESYYMLKDAVLEPECSPFRKVHGESFFEYFSKNPRLGQLFNQTLGILSLIYLDKVFEVYDGFVEVKELMDVGGGNGTSIGKILSTYPHIHGINFDLPHVIADASYYPGVDYVSGDMFESLPKTLTILLKWVLHDWNDDQCIKLLRNCIRALPDDGKVIVVEFVNPQEIGNDKEALGAIVAEFSTMILNSGGKERTTKEFDFLAKAAGFAQTKLFPIAHGIHVLEFLKQ